MSPDQPAIVAAFYRGPSREVKSCAKVNAPSLNYTMTID
jgi:hypothetical protein